MLKVKFDKKLYKMTAIKDSIEAYAEVADFVVARVGDSIEIEIKNVDDDLKGIIKDEFCNHVLAGMQQHR